MAIHIDLNKIISFWLKINKQGIAKKFPDVYFLTNKYSGGDISSGLDLRIQCYIGGCMWGCEQGHQLFSYSGDVTENN